MTTHHGTAANAASDPRAGTAASETTPTLWEFVPLGDYQPPSMPASSALKDAWNALKRVFRNMETDIAEPAREEARLRSLPQVRLEHLVTPIDHDEPASALDVALGDWLEEAGKPTRAVRFVVGQPHGGNAETLRRWAARHDAPVIAPPSYAQILDGNTAWFDAWPENEPWVLPDLAHCYLRHARGLDLVRTLLERAESGGLGRGLIGCDSWGWAYLQRVWPVPRPDALTLQALDGPRLARLLTHQIEPGGRQRIHFRNAANGQDILTIPSTGDSGAEVTSCTELAQLAAHARGNVGVALAYWCESLREQPESEDVESEPAEENIWVSARIGEPSLPIESDEDIALILHALLLHDGLPASLLPELLPLPHHHCMALLLRLRNAGLVECGEDQWKVSATGYTPVRGLLQRRDYLTDGL